MVLADRVQETTSTAGTGAVTLEGAVLGYQRFAAIGDGSQTYYTITHARTGEWEVGIGTYAADTLTRDTVLGSSNANALVPFSPGQKQVFITYPAGKALHADGLYADPPWITALAGSKITGPIANVVYTTASYADPSWIISLSGSKITGPIANVVYTTGSYADPAWITSLDGGKITGSISGSQVSGAIANVVYTTGSYADPSWITSLSGSKITGAIANVVYTTGSYSNPSWITSLDGSKITGTISGSQVSGAIANVVYASTSATDSAIVLYNGDTGRSVKNSTTTIGTALVSSDFVVPTSLAVKAVTDLKANTADVVLLTGNQTVAGRKSFSDFMGVGTTAVTDSVIKAEGTFTGANSVIFGFYFIPVSTPSASGVSELYGLSAYPTLTGDSSSSVLAGAIIRPTISHATAATVTNVYGITFNPNFSAASKGITTNLRNAFVRNPAKSASSTETITTHTQVYIEAPTRGTTNWAIYSEGAASYHAGDWLVGTTTSSGRLTVRGSGTSSAANGLLVEDSGGTDNFVVRNDGGFAFRGGTVGLAQTGYTTFTNLTTDRTCDANATTVEELADILGTLIVDLKTKGIIAA